MSPQKVSLEFTQETIDRAYSAPTQEGIKHGPYIPDEWPFNQTDPRENDINEAYGGGAAKDGFTLLAKDRWEVAGPNAHQAVDIEDAIKYSDYDTLERLAGKIATDAVRERHAQEDAQLAEAQTVEANQPKPLQ